jgi:hypothetical protein
MHEASTIRLRGMLIFLGCFVGSAIVIHAGVYGLFAWYRHEAKGENVATTALRDVRTLPREPRLQPSVGHSPLAAVDLAEMRERDRAAFEQRHWVDRTSDQVRIPDEIVAQVAQLSAPPQTPTTRRSR